MNSKFCLALGLSADWGQVRALFLHCFDYDSHDIAISRSEIDWFLELLDRLFIQGHIWTRISKSEPSVGNSIGRHLATAAPLPETVSKRLKQAEDADPILLTEFVRKQIERKCVFRAGGFPVLCWDGYSKTDLDELSGRIANVAKVVIARVHAEFPEEDMRSWLQCFDVKNRIALGRERSADDDLREKMRKRLCHCVKCFAHDVGEECCSCGR